MAKAKTVFVCSECGNESSKWMGRCSCCGEWNTMHEQQVVPVSKAKSNKKSDACPVRMEEVPLEQTPRISCGIEELDRVLGGGLIEGMAVLVGGEPGVGKSTLLLQACEHLIKTGKPVLYVSGEESKRQLKMRASRLGLNCKELLVMTETNADQIIEYAENLDKPVIIIDSIQTMSSSDTPSAPGSVSQIKECAASFIRLAKEGGASVFMIGHVTKEGAIAGPRILEHMVDTVLYFEGEKNNSFRILRAVKNRFGSTNEIGVFEMMQDGMRQVQNPSEMLVSMYTKGAAGSAVTCTMEGTRPVLCEIQALCPNSVFGQPRRMATGVDYNRMLLMSAVIERKTGIALYKYDLYLNAAGGLKLSEPACDLAVVAAIVSAATLKPVKEGFALIGEVGLTGEVRSVSQLQKRAQECAKMGYIKLIAPSSSVKSANNIEGIEVLGVDDITTALNLCLGQAKRPNFNENN